MIHHYGFYIEAVPLDTEHPIFSEFEDFEAVGETCFGKHGWFGLIHMPTVPGGDAEIGSGPDMTGTVNP